MSSPTVARRSSSAARATARTSGPRARNSATISCSPSSLPSSTPRNTSPTGPCNLRERAATDGFVPTSCGGGLLAPEYHCVERWPMSTTSAPSCTTSAAVTFSGQIAPGSSRPKFSASQRSSTLKRSDASIQRGVADSPISAMNSGYTVRRGANARPDSSVTSRSRSRAGHGRSGFTWSAVTGETPPQSSMPAVSSAPKSSLKFGGACRCISGGKINRATAIDHRYSSGSHAGSCCMPVRGLGKKFCTITSCTWPCRKCDAAMASSAAMRSARFSPMPTKMPVVKGICSSPANSRVSKRRCGTLSGAPRWHSRSSRRVSTIMPCEGETRRNIANSSLYNAPALAWGSRPVSVSTNLAMSCR